MSANEKCPVCHLELPADVHRCPRCAGDPGRTWQSEASPAETPGTGAADRGERYEVIDTLGRGAMGVVYKVRDRELDEVIALKVLEPLYEKSPDVVDRFKQELKIARRINHPNVARLFDLVSWRDRLAISQEFIDGKSLEAILEPGPLPVEDIRRYLRYLASALDAAHKLGVVHRDLKPANILIDREDRPRIVDFGLAIQPGKTSDDGTRGWVVGTPLYMSPEQVLTPDDVDWRSDLYSLGVILFRMATGRVPFPEPSAKLARAAHVHTPPPRPREIEPALPAAFDEVLLKALAKDRTKRYASARELEEDLESRLAQTKVPPVALPGGTLGKALLVDDDPALREMVGAMLAHMGVVAIGAKDGYEGIEMAMREAPGLIFLDLSMPVLDGRETLRILKTNPKTAAIPVVMLTGSTDPDEALFSKEIGAAVFVNKPIEPDVLELLVEKYLRAKTG